MMRSGPKKQGKEVRCKRGMIQDMFLSQAGRIS